MTTLAEPTTDVDTEAEATCPTCSKPVPGLLALCWEPDCLSAAIRADAAWERGLDL